MWRLLLAQTKEAVPAEVAEEGAAQAPAGPAGFGSLLGNPMILIVLMFVALWFLMIQPQRKRDKERRNMLASLAKGDAVVTTGGICGTVASLTDTKVVLKVDEKVNLEFLRSAIAQVTARGGDPKK